MHHLVMQWQVAHCLQFLEVLIGSQQWRTEGRGGFQPPPHPRNSEGPPKSYQTQPDCENC